MMWRAGGRAGGVRIRAGPAARGVISRVLGRGSPCARNQHSLIRLIHPSYIQVVLPASLVLGKRVSAFGVHVATVAAAGRQSAAILCDLGRTPIRRPTQGAGVSALALTRWTALHPLFSVEIHSLSQAGFRWPCGIATRGGPCLPVAELLFFAGAWMVGGTAW